MELLKIHFVSLDPNLSLYIQKYFKNIPNISSQTANLLDCEATDCIISPGNCFGQMDGGIDIAISQILSPSIGKKVRKVIKEKYGGEQPIGTCILIKTNNKKYPFLAHVPTMMIPKNVNKTLNAYFAFKAVLMKIIRYNKKNTDKIESILTTTFCTGCGDMSLKKSVKQMSYAYQVLKRGIGSNWDDANKHCLNLENLK